MRCDYAHDDGAYVLGALSPAERAAYEHHLAGCPSCRQGGRRHRGAARSARPAGSSRLRADQRPAVDRAPVGHPGRRGGPGPPPGPADAPLADRRGGAGRRRSRDRGRLRGRLGGCRRYAGYRARFPARRDAAGGFAVADPRRGGSAGGGQRHRGHHALLVGADQPGRPTDGFRTGRLRPGRGQAAGRLVGGQPRSRDRLHRGYPVRARPVGTARTGPCRRRGDPGVPGWLTRSVDWVG
ncbi:zf-HC2 domain-containing protein [Micromonospora sp. Llam0]|uniref:zf-HC2 domain-containing protein n=1 Tax=Micromonospora sp. Llam0 TaxID=2485143 RepID=UPI001F328740|nr:zf-HC2 domain-containing protein [Micromonospora sp. Llam0]